MKKGLGKGMKAIFHEDLPENGSFFPTGAETELKITDVQPNKKQPRQEFDKEKLDGLAESIREHGVIQPIIVVPSTGGMYTIVAGERRWRAARLAGLKTIPAIVKEYSPEEIAQIALIENLQREDLNPVEEALGYQSLMSEYNMTQDQVSKTIGKSRSAIANSVRLLMLGDEIKKLLEQGLISSGHARAILSLSDEKKRILLANRIVSENLNVRQAEGLAKFMEKNQARIMHQAVKTPEISALEEKLSSGFGTKVSISHGAKRGKIEIEYYNNDDFDRIVKLFKI